MHRFCWLILLVVFTGCGKDSHEQVTVDYLNIMEQFVKVCDAIGNPEEAKSAKAEIANLLGELKQLKSRSTKLGVAKTTERETIEKKYQTKFDTLTEKYSETITKIEKQPEVVAELESELKTLASLVNARPIRLKK